MAKANGTKPAGVAHRVPRKLYETELARLQAEQRVLLVFTPDRPVTAWIARGFD